MLSRRGQGSQDNGAHARGAAMLLASRALWPLTMLALPSVVSFAPKPSALLCRRSGALARAVEACSCASLISCVRVAPLRRAALCSTCSWGDDVSAKAGARKDLGADPGGSLERLDVPSQKAPNFEAYVKRKALKARISKHVSKVEPSKYLVVVGPLGGGKSTTIKQEGAGRPTQGCVREARFWLFNDCFRASEAVKVEDIFRPFVRLEGEEKPVLVVEVDSDVDAGTVRMQSQQVKTVCVDE
eukprot:6212367-Pleurochrysis_carterae.AAC.4